MRQTFTVLARSSANRTLIATKQAAARRVRRPPRGETRKKGDKYHVVTATWSGECRLVTALTGKTQGAKEPQRIDGQILSMTMLKTENPNGFVSYDQTQKSCKH